MTEGQNSILWRIARLHPGWVTLLVCSGYVMTAVGAAFGGESPVAVAFYAGVAVIHLGYPLFVLLFVSRRFRSLASARRGRAIAAFAIAMLLGIFAGLVDREWYAASIEAGNAFAIAAHIALTIGGFLAIFYLLIGAAVALAEAEKAGSARFGRKFGTALQFFYLPFCVFFIHRRIQRLLAPEGMPDPIIDELPMERLALKPVASGHLSLELTERPGWGDFGRYAEELLSRLDGRAVEKASVVDMHIWNIEIETVPLQLVYEDHPNRICLESNSYPGDMLLRQLQRRLARPDAA